MQFPPEPSALLISNGDDPRGEVAQLAVSLMQLLRLLGDALLGALSFADVAHGAGNQKPFHRLQRARTDFRGKCRTILADGRELSDVIAAQRPGRNEN